MLMFRLCCVLPSINFSSASVRNILPVKTSAMTATFVVISVKVHREGVFAGDGGTVRRALPSRFVFFFEGFFRFPLDTDRGLDREALNGETDLGLLFKMPRGVGILGLGFEEVSSYHP
jgi:hypothetical protein